MVLINGKESDVAGKAVLGVIQELNYDLRTIAVELNEEIIPKAALGERLLKDGDVLEIVSFVGGG